MGSLKKALYLFPLMAAMFGGNINNYEPPKYKSSTQYGGYGGGRGVFGSQAIYHPKRTKLKGWQKENRRSSFNKKRRTA